VDLVEPATGRTWRRRPTLDTWVFSLAVAEFAAAQVLG
jgi:hypothetical protein